MKHDAKPWPPLILASQQPVWVRWRDFVITAVMWLLLAAMLNKEFELFLSAYLERLGFGAMLDRVGLVDFDEKPGWVEVVTRLSPYLIVVIILVALLTIFATHTYLRRRRSLRAVSPRPLSLASQAWHGALAHMVSNEGAEPRQLYAGLGELPEVEGPGLLVLLQGQDEAALVEARRLRVAMVNVTAEGRYRIERWASGSPELAPVAP